jgi:hypothetical protein
MQSTITPNAVPSSQPKSLLWRAYFWIALACLALYAYEVASSVVAGNTSIGPFVGLAASVVAMWPLYGFITQKRMNPRWLWRVALVILGASLLASLVVFAMLMFAGKLGPLASVATSALLASLQVYALFKYIHRSPHIWK